MKYGKNIKKNVKKKTESLTVSTLQNSWPVSLDLKHNQWKNHETQSPTNQMSKDETGGGKNLSHTKIIIK
jgi:hypothetical protein